MVTADDIEEQAHQLPVGELAFKAVGVKKHYPGVKALDGVDLEGYAGSVLGVCGANGAGKVDLREAAGRGRDPDRGRDHDHRLSRTRCATRPRPSRPGC